jgi:hypothetical protein
MDFTAIKFVRAFLEALFIGFGIVITVISLLKRSNLKLLHLKELFILKAIQAIRIAGIVYALTYLYEVNLIYFQKASAANSLTPSKLLPSAYLTYMFYPPLAYFLLTQLLWIKPLYIKKAALTVLALAILIAPLWLNISALLFAPQEDFQRPEWYVILSHMLTRSVGHIIIFFVTILTLMLLSGKFRPSNRAS